MYLSKLELVHLPKPKNIGKHKFKLYFNSSAPFWSTLKKWLVRLFLLVIVFLLGLTIGKQHNSPEYNSENSPTANNRASQSLAASNPPVETALPGKVSSLLEHQTVAPVSPNKIEFNAEDKEKDSIPLTVAPNLLTPAQTLPTNVVKGKNSVTTSISSTHESSSSLPAPTSLSAAVNPEVVNRLRQCENFLKNNRLTTGPTGNALTCYQQLLSQFDNLPQAKAGLQKIEDRYRTLIETALTQAGSVKKLREYLIGLRQVNPQSDLLAQVDRHYQTKIESAISASQLSQAQRYWKELSVLNPKSALLTKLEAQLKSAVPKVEQVSTVVNSKVLADRATTATPAQQIAQLLQQCQTLLKANHLLTGSTGNAVECYQQVLTLAPNHTKAKAGLKQIEQRYQTWTQNALKKGQLAKAKSYLNNLRQVNSASPVLNKLQRQIDKPAPAPMPSIEKSAPAQVPSPAVVSQPTPSPVVPAKKPTTVHPPKAPTVTPAPRPKSSPAPSTRPSESASAIPPVVKPATPSFTAQPPRCSEIFIQESLGIQPLNKEEREFKRKYCN